MSYSKEIEPGSIYKVTLDDTRCALLQFLCVDASQLWSDVVRVFEGTFPIDISNATTDMALLPVAFETHTSIMSGVKMRAWKFIGIAPTVERAKTIYRLSEDYGNPEVKFSRRWYVWYPNENKRFVGELDGETRLAEIGTATSPHSIIHRILTGERTHWYPAG
jgi:hypothetical protein